MSFSFDFKITDNSDIVRKAAEEREDALLEAFGVQGTNNIQNLITASGHVDTGLMRNSITWAVSGKAPETTEYKADKGPGRGAYFGTAPDAPSGQKAVYIGSNLDYFVYQNEGYHLPNGTFVPGIHVLQNGVTQLQAQAETIAGKVTGG